MSSDSAVTILLFTLRHDVLEYSLRHLTRRPADSCCLSTEGLVPGPQERAIPRLNGTSEEATNILLDLVVRLGRVLLLLLRDSQDPLWPIESRLQFVAHYRDRFRYTERGDDGRLRDGQHEGHLQVDVAVERVRSFSHDITMQKDRYMFVRAEIEVLDERETCFEHRLDDASSHEWQRQAADDLAVQHIMRTQALEAGARVDTLEDTGSNSYLEPLLRVDGAAMGDCRETSRGGVRNGYNINGSGPKPAQAVRECSYSEFLKCKPLDFKGTRRSLSDSLEWFEKMEDGLA
ncbi:hypothetical protein Tco_1176708 [Tanacetum coccineum]